MFHVPERILLHRRAHNDEGQFLALQTTQKRTVQIRTVRTCTHQTKWSADHAKHLVSSLKSSQVPVAEIQILFELKTYLNLFDRSLILTVVLESSCYSGGTAQVRCCHHSKGLVTCRDMRVLLRPNAACLNGKKLLEGLSEG